jgi:sigma-B regulation protein RsbU (phosphoserine phosphatase)
MPSQVPQLEGWDLAVTYLVNGSPGGDYYDFFPLAGNRLGLLVADASGHGGLATILVAQVRAFLHSCPLACARTFSPFCLVGACNVPSPGVILGQISRLVEENSLSEQFMTAFYGVLALDTGILHYANAGHPPPRLWRAALESMETLPDCSGPPLGLGLADTYRQTSVILRPGDILMIYTDGLVDARNRRDMAFGVGRLDTGIQSGVGHGAVGVNQKVMDSWTKFLGRKQLDATFVVLGRSR